MNLCSFVHQTLPLKIMCLCSESIKQTVPVVAVAYAPFLLPLVGKIHHEPRNPVSNLQIKHLQQKFVNWDQNFAPVHCKIVHHCYLKIVISLGQKLNCRAVSLQAFSSKKYLILNKQQNMISQNNTEANISRITFGYIIRETVLASRNY